MSVTRPADSVLEFLPLSSSSPTVSKKFLWDRCVTKSVALSCAWKIDLVSARSSPSEQTSPLSQPNVMIPLPEVEQVEFSGKTAVDSFVSSAPDPGRPWRWRRASLSKKLNRFHIPPDLWKASMMAGSFPYSAPCLAARKRVFGLPLLEKRDKESIDRFWKIWAVGDVNFPMK